MPRFTCLAVLLAAGCMSLPRPPMGQRGQERSPAASDLQQVSHESAVEYPGQVYLFRGGGGIFSLGMDTLGKRLTAIGVANDVKFHPEWWFMADGLAKDREKAHGPIILVGHSYGADAAIRLACKLDARNVPVDLIVTIDPVTPPGVPKNVKHVYNIYRDQGAWDVVPIWRGIPLNKAIGADAVRLENIHVQEHPDLDLPGLSHSNIDDNLIIQQEIIRQILKTCKRQ